MKDLKEYMQNSTYFGTYDLERLRLQDPAADWRPDSITELEAQGDALYLWQLSHQENPREESKEHFMAKLNLFNELRGLVSLWSPHPNPHQWPTPPPVYSAYMEYPVPQRFYHKKDFSWAKLAAAKQCRPHHFMQENRNVVPLPSRSEELYGPRCFVFDIAVEGARGLMGAIEVVHTAYPTEGKKTWCRFYPIPLLVVTAEWLIKNFIGTDLMYLELEDGRRAPWGPRLFDQSAWIR